MRKDETRPLTDEELEEITASTATPTEIEEARQVLRSAWSDSWERDGLESLSVPDLVRRLQERLAVSEDETRRLQFLVRRLHDSLPPTPDAEGLRTELEREVERMIRPGG